MQRYGLDVVGGAEYLARLVAERLRKYFEIEVITTCAKSYHTWKNEYGEGTDIINGILVRRFKNSKMRNPDLVNQIQDKIFYNAHTKSDELRWIQENGPYSPFLIEYLKKNNKEYDCFVFFTFRYYPSYYGIKCVGHKSLIAPFAENDPALDLSTTKEIFHNVRGIIYSTPEERDLIRQRACFDDKGKIRDIVGCGIEVPDSIDDSPLSLDKDYMIYVGRIEGSKGCYQLFEYYQQMAREHPDMPELVLVGLNAIPIPEHRNITYLGFVSEQKKFELIKNAKFLIMPSPFESFSLVTLEAMACGIPVLVNGECDVLKGHCQRSNAGLWYHNYDEFYECIKYLVTHDEVRDKMGDNGRRYISENYTWKKVEKCYLKLIEELKEVSES